MDPKQPWLFEPPPRKDEATKPVAPPLSEEDCRDIGNMFAELLINYLSKKQEARNAGNEP